MSVPAGEIWLYKDTKYGGTCWKLKESNPLFDDLGCNNKVSSLRCGPGTTVILYANSKFGGDSIEYNQDCSDLKSWSDKSSSAKVLKSAPFNPTPNPGEVYAYRDGNFESFVWIFKEACPDVAKVGAKKQISSVRVGPNTEAVLYDDVNFSGKTVTVGKNSPGLESFNDKTSSIKIFKSA